jgi:hypothetical protein
VVLSAVYHGTNGFLFLPPMPPPAIVMQPDQQERVAAAQQQERVAAAPAAQWKQEDKVFAQGISESLLRVTFEEDPRERWRAFMTIENKMDAFALDGADNERLVATLRRGGVYATCVGLCTSPDANSKKRAADVVGTVEPPEKKHKEPAKGSCDAVRSLAQLFDKVTLACPKPDSVRAVTMSELPKQQNHLGLRLPTAPLASVEEFKLMCAAVMITLSTRKEQGSGATPSYTTYVRSGDPYQDLRSASSMDDIKGVFTQLSDPLHRKMLEDVAKGLYTMATAQIVRLFMQSV